MKKKKTAAERKSVADNLIYHCVSIVELAAMSSFCEKWSTHVAAIDDFATGTISFIDRSPKMYSLLLFCLCEEKKNPQ